MSKLRMSVRGPDPNQPPVKPMPQIPKLIRDRLPKGLLPPNPLKKPRKKTPNP